MAAGGHAEIDEPGDSQDESDTGTSDAVAFLGTITVGDREFAVIRHKSRQFWLAPGRERNGVRLEEIGDGFVRVVVGGTPQRVPRGDRDSGSIGSASLPTVQPMGSQPGRRVRGADPGRSTPRVDPGGSRPGVETPPNFADMTVEERREWVQRRNEAARAARGASVTEDQR
ncbi:MAG: hypothetical protein H6811_03170 [Phycisphaeraceae bacterium]|nr:hypothetical protein [Phycisphaeraceae bacterium]